MRRLALVLSPLLFSLSGIAQTTSQATASDPFAVSLAQKSILALTGGASISDVTLNANVISILGSDYETGTATFKAKGTAESRIDMSLPVSGSRSDVRNSANGNPAGAWEKNGGSPTAYAGHNCWTDASWFFPALSSLTQTANSYSVFTYVGQEQHQGVSTQHIRVSQPGPIQTLSTMDFYLDPSSLLPLSIAFAMHPDDDTNTNILVEVLFAKYQVLNGVSVPLHFQRMINGTVVLDATVTTATFNSGVLDNAFALP